MKEVLYRVKEERNIVHAIKRRKGKWIGHRLRRNCLLRYVNEETMGGKGRPERKLQLLLEVLRKTKEYRNLKEKSLYRSVWRTRFGRVYSLS